MPTSHDHYTNPRLHFFFCPNQKTLDEMKEDEAFDNQTNKNEESNNHEDNTQKPVPKKYCLDLTKFKKVHHAMLTEFCCSNDEKDIMEEETSDSDYTDDDSNYTDKDFKNASQKETLKIVQNINQINFMLNIIVVFATNKQFDAMSL